MKKCDKCHINEVRVIIESVGEFCLDCHNEMMAEELGVELFDQYTKNIAIYDNNGEIHSFEINNLILPIFSVWRAEEINGGYEFEVMVDLDEEQIVGIKHLHSKILRGVGYKSMFLYEGKQPIENALIRNGKQYGLKEVGTAGINYDEDTNNNCLIIDGELISFEEFGVMASSYEGCTMDYQIRDKSDEILGKDMILKQMNINKNKLYEQFERTLSWFLEDNNLSDYRSDAFEEALMEKIDDYELAAKYGDINELHELGAKMIDRLLEIKYGGEYNPEFIIEEIEEIMDSLLNDDEDIESEDE